MKNVTLLQFQQPKKVMLAKHVVYVLIYIPAFVKQRVEKKKLIRVLKLICIYLNLVLVPGRDASILLGLLKEFIPLTLIYKGLTI